MCVSVLIAFIFFTYVPHAGESRRGHNEPQREQLRVVQPIGGRRNGQWFEPPLLRDGTHSNPGHLLTVQVLESEPNNQTHSERRERKAKSTQKAMRSRRVVLPVIRQQAMQLQSQIMRENVQDVTSDASIHMPATSMP